MAVLIKHATTIDPSEHPYCYVSWSIKRTYDKLVVIESKAHGVLGRQCQTSSLAVGIPHTAKWDKFHSIAAIGCGMFGADQNLISDMPMVHLHVVRHQTLQTSVG